LNPVYTKLLNPARFLELAFALKYVRSVHRAPISHSSELTVSDQMLEKLAEAYRAFMAATGLDQHQDYYKVKDCSHKNLRRQLLNLEQKHVIKLHYNQVVRPPVVDRVIVNLTLDQAEQLLLEAGYRPELESALQEIPGFELPAA
jgi:hypothetical protein